MRATDLGIRIGPQYVPVEEEVESMHLKFLAQPPTGNFTDAVYRFNSCVQYRYYTNYTSVKEQEADVCSNFKNKLRTIPASREEQFF